MAGEKRGTSISIRTHAWIRDRLQEEAEAQERSISWLMEKLALEYIKKQDTKAKSGSKSNRSGEE